MPGMSSTQRLLRINHRLRKDMCLFGKSITDKIPDSWRFSSTTLHNSATPPIHIPFNWVSQIPRSEIYSKSDLPKFKLHSTCGVIFSLRLPDLTPISISYHNLVPHNLNAKLIGMGVEELIPRLLTADAIAEFPQCDFNRTSLTVSQSHFKLPLKEDDLKGIPGL